MPFQNGSPTPCLLTACVVMVLAFPSCNPIQSVNPEPMSKDHLLLATILDAIGEQGYHQLRMPNPDDYASIPQDPNNPLTVDKVKLGRMLFHETALGTQAQDASGMGTYSCASCHHAAAGFQAGVQQGLGDGGVGFGVRGEGREISQDYAPNEIDRQPMRSPTAMNGAFTPVTLWNGQFGAHGPNVGTESNWTEGTPIATNLLGYMGLETQAIAGLTVHRMAPTAHFFDSLSGYLPLFDAAFPEFPIEERYGVETAGLAIAAFERTVMGYEAPFQKWMRGEHTAMTTAQKEGAMVFFGAGKCGTCHNGPGLTDGGFHALGMPDMPDMATLDAGLQDYGLSQADLALGRGGFTGQDGDKHAFKTPQLYNLKDSHFYGHGGTFYTLEEVIAYKVNGLAAKPEAESYLSADFEPLTLSAAQQHSLLEFLEGGLHDPDLHRYLPNAVLSGNCFPNNDPASSVDLGCEPG